MAGVGEADMSGQPRGVFGAGNSIAGSGLDWKMTCSGSFQVLGSSLWVLGLRLRVLVFGFWGFRFLVFGFWGLGF